MSKFNLDDIAKKVDLKVDEAVKKLKEAGIDIDSSIKMVGDDEVRILGLDPRRLQIDKRQDLLKKALERHKRNPQTKEVIIKDIQVEPFPKRLTKDELLKKKNELKKSLAKVEEERKDQEISEQTKLDASLQVKVEKIIVKEHDQHADEASSEEIVKPADEKQVNGKPEDESAVEKPKDTVVEELFEKKKIKAKKSVKKVKHVQKDILEGIDELNIEKEVVAVDEVKKEEETTVRPPVEKQKYVKQVFVRPNEIEMGENISVCELSALIGIKAPELLSKLMHLGVTSNINQFIDSETASLICADYNIEVNVKSVTEQDLLPLDEDKPEDLEPRPPIVTVMGHVDHGKTSLLDAIRKTNIAEFESGGITQHIGAYEVETKNGKIAFLDTPGHEAFTSLRARGANVTDIAILIVAADDGVMPQTKEAIDHIKAAGVKMVVAINKIDKDGANVEKVKTQLSEYGIIPEEWGGDYQFQEISAKKKIGIDDLLDKVLLEAELLDLKANFNKKATGVVIESRLDKHKGPIASVIVKNGTLKKGDSLVVGLVIGKVRSMFNYSGKLLKEATPSTPVEIMGLVGLPQAGEKFMVVDDDSVAKHIIELRAEKLARKGNTGVPKVSVESIFEKIKEGEIESLNIIMKADTQGSIEALKNSIMKLSNTTVKVNIIHGSVGSITESDVMLASAAGAYIVGFNVRPDQKAIQLAGSEGVDIHTYSIIYDVVNDVKNLVQGLVAPVFKENVIGRAEIRQVFNVPKVGKICGSYVLDGHIVRGANARVIRDNVVIYDGKIDSLRRFKDDAKEVTAGFECGLNISNFNDVKENDIIEVYEEIEEKRSVSDTDKDGGSKGR